MALRALLFLSALTLLAAQSRTGARARADVSVPKAVAYLDQRAAAWADETHRPSVSGGRCALSCHTTVPYMAVRSGLPGSTDVVGRVRGYVEDRVLHWDTVTPLYAWIPEKSRGTEAVVDAATLAATDVSSGATSAVTRRAFANLWAQQEADGAFPWWDGFELAPWENVDARVWGAAEAALAVGVAPGYVATITPEERAKLLKLDRFLAGRVAEPTEPLNNRAMILLAATHRPDMLSTKAKSGVLTALRNIQRTDGAWDAASLGWTPATASASAASTATEGHAFATAFFTYVLQRAGDGSGAIDRGRQWLESHQDESGAWRATSLNAPDAAFNNGLITDAATVYAAAVLASP